MTGNISYLMGVEFLIYNVMHSIGPMIHKNKAKRCTYRQ